MTKSAYIGLFSLLVLMVVLSLLLHSIFVNPSAPIDSLPADSASHTVYTSDTGRRASADDHLLIVNSRSVTEPQPAPETVGEETAYGNVSPETVVLADRSDVVPAAVQPVRHTIEKGDTYHSLAEKYYGSSGYCRLIEQANPDKPANKLKINDVVLIPPRPQDAVPQPQSGDQGGATLKDYKTYEVRSGDGFRKIAREQMGDENRWRELYELNRGLGIVKNETDLVKGQKIALPAQAKP